MVVGFEAKGHSLCRVAPLSCAGSLTVIASWGKERSYIGRRCRVDFTLGTCNFTSLWYFDSNHSIFVHVQYVYYYIISSVSIIYVIGCLIYDWVVT